MIKKTALLIFSLLIVLQGLKAQEINSEIEYPKTLVRLHFPAPGILIEQNIKNNFNIIADLATGLGYQIKIGNGASESNMFLFPYVKIEPRIYTSLEKRKSLGRRTDYYSSQYVALQAKFGFATNQLSAWNSFGALWGFQRTLGKKGYWNIGLGLGVTTYNGIGTFGPIGDFGIGFILN